MKITDLSNEPTTGTTADGSGDVVTSTTETSQTTTAADGSTTDTTSGSSSDAASSTTKESSPSTPDSAARGDGLVLAVIAFFAMLLVLGGVVGCVVRVKLRKKKKGRDGPQIAHQVCGLLEWRVSTGGSLWVFLLGLGVTGDCECGVVRNRPKLGVWKWGIGSAVWGAGLDHHGQLGEEQRWDGCVWTNERVAASP